MTRVLVAGSTGYLGGYVVRELARRGSAIRALTRSPEKLQTIAGAIDEIATCEVTRPETLAGVCDGVDVVFSSVGMTRQKESLTFRDVDYRANLNLLEAAVAAGVRRFVYVSVFDGPDLRHLDIVDAHEAFVDELAASGTDYAVIRPTGYFSDMNEIFEMARRGRVWLIGRGDNRCNPIHGADLAVVCVDAIEGHHREIDVGGPEVLTWREAAERAFAVLDRPPKINRVPERIMWWVVRLARIMNRHQGELLAFFTTMSTRDVVAPGVGTRRLGEHFARQVGCS